MATGIGSYGVVRSTADLGRLVRLHRKQRNLTLETVAGLSNVGIRFLSEFERGKGTAEIGKVLQVMRSLGLEMVILPRGQVQLPGLAQQTEDGHL
ncbi:MAG: helix-turn-helix domain-containing protein [Acidithiobacillus sp.]